MDFNYLNGFAVVSWVKLMATADCSQGCPIFGRFHSDTEDFGYSLTLEPSGGGHSFKFKVANGPVLATTVLPHSKAIDLGKYYHVAVSFDAVSLSSGIMSLCVDAVCETMTTASGVLGYTIHSQFVVAGQYNDSRTTNLEMDELVICNTPWTPAEVDEHFQNTKVAPSHAIQRGRKEQKKRQNCGWGEAACWIYVIQLITERK